MKKASLAEDNNANLQGKEGSKLNRSSMQLANRLDIQLKSVVEWQELFQPDAIALRHRLRTQCEMLILKHSKEYGRRAEERLWRKVFYDVIQKLRSHRKILEEDSAGLDAVLRTHLSSAAGYYYHLLTHLQLFYHLTLDSALSWGFPSSQKAVVQDDETVSWAIRACQRCLIYLGDIARYQSDLEGEDAIKLAERFYCEAALINPDIGMPQNQLGTLAGTKAFGCEGAYFYMRCLLSKEVFEGAEGNLLRIFEKNRSILYRIKELPLDEPQPKERLKRFLVYFLYLQDVLYQHESSPEISSEDIGHLCQSVLQDFSSVLSVDPSSSNGHKPAMENGLSPQENGHQDADVTDDKDGVISSSLMVKLVVMAISTVTRLQSNNSQESSVAAAFTLAFLSLLLQHCISSFENFLAKDQTSSEQNVANGPQKTAATQNGLSAEKLQKHENSSLGLKATKPLKDFNETKTLKKALKHRRRRRRRRNVDYSFESYSGSGSDFDESGGENDEDSDLSEGGGDVENVLEDLMSDDSDDVYVESESDSESGNTGSVPKTVFNSSGGENQLDKNSLPKSTEKFSSHQALLGKQGLKGGFLWQNGISVGKIFRPDLFSDVSDAETESSVASRTEILRDCVESNLLKAMAGQKLLPAIKVLTDWLRLNAELVTSCVESLGALWSRLASLLNMFPSAEQMMAAVPIPRRPTWRGILDETLDENWVQTRGLPEDMSLLGFTPLTAIHSKLDKKWSRLTRDCHYLEAAVRVQCLKSFGMKLALTEELSSCVWDQSKQQFLGPQQMAEREKRKNSDKQQTPSTPGNRSRVMKAMAQQLLQSEVAELESTLKTTPHGSTAYLVPDAMSLCSQLHLVRRLVTAEKMVIIIPIQVIAALDELKKYDSGAREATKFLEQEFKKGNRWIRAQKENETLGGGKKRGRYEDVAVWRFNQIINCCRYFINQTGKGLVTLLTGGSSYESPKRGQKKGMAASGTQATPEAVELARNCGINVESLRVFCARFSQQAKSVT